VGRDELVERAGVGGHGGWRGLDVQALRLGRQPGPRRDRRPAVDGAERSGDQGRQLGIGVLGPRVQPTQQRERALVVGDDEVRPGLADRRDQRSLARDAVEPVLTGEPFDRLDRVGPRPAGGDFEAGLDQGVGQPCRGEPAHGGQQHRSLEAGRRPYADPVLAAQGEPMVDHVGHRGRRRPLMHHGQVVAVDADHVDGLGQPVPQPDRVAAEMPVDHRRHQRHRAVVAAGPVATDRGNGPDAHDLLGRRLDLEAVGAVTAAA
jgi:hypothetical protein